ncbi:MAG: amidase, partial [Bacteroidia bacterium]|nr:amidase [Bacteroidia bacterium]
YILSRNPCGSSSGSAVAVSANLCVLAIGTETNGSIVCPSNANGIVGIKPTVGLVSRDGIIPISSTQDTAGPMARTVEDAAICLGALTQSDPSDKATLTEGRNVRTDYTTYLDPDGLQSKRIGVLNASRDFHHRVSALFDNSLDIIKKAGAELVEINKISDTPSGGDSFTVMLYEFKDGLNKYFESLGPESKIKSIDDLIEFNKKDSIELKYFDQDLLELAAEKGSLEDNDYKEARQRMLENTRENGIDKVMDENKLDLIIAPTGSPAWKTDLINGDRFLGGSSSPAARAGYPSITCPMGFIDGLPVGISFFGKAWSEGTLIEAAYAFEQKTKMRQPPKFIRD